MDIFSLDGCSQAHCDIVSYSVADKSACKSIRFVVIIECLLAACPYPIEDLVLRRRSAGVEPIDELADRPVGKGYSYLTPGLGALAFKVADIVRLLRLPPRRTHLYSKVWLWAVADTSNKRSIGPFRSWKRLAA
jgi:dihydropteroate synthase